jgi:hypothetical protein
MKYIIACEDFKDGDHRIIESHDNKFDAYEMICDLAFDNLKSKDGDNYCRKIYDKTEKQRPWNHFIECDLKKNNGKNLFNSLLIRNKIKINYYFWHSAVFQDVCKYYIIEN